MKNTRKRGERERAAERGSFGGARFCPGAWKTRPKRGWLQGRQRGLAGWGNGETKHWRMGPPRASPSAPSGPQPRLHQGAGLGDAMRSLSGSPPCSCCRRPINRMLDRMVGCFSSCFPPSRETLCHCGSRVSCYRASKLPAAVAAHPVSAVTWPFGRCTGTAGTKQIA